MIISVIICTRNRAQSLQITLQELSRIEVGPEYKVEIVVVDNGSSDETELVVRDASINNLFDVLYVSEQRPGLSFARNLGILESKGEILLFTDDDVRPPRGWITEMVEPIVSGKADAVAGAVHLAAHLERPWLRGALRVAVACTLDQESGACGPHLVGANMAVGRYVFDQLGGFDTALGAGALGFGEETLLSYRLVTAGYRIAPKWDVVVEHWCDVERLNRDYYMVMAERMGRSQGYIAYHWEGKTIRICRLVLFWTLSKMYCRRLFNLLNMDKQCVFEWEFSYLVRVGCIRQFMAERRGPRKYIR